MMEQNKSLRDVIWQEMEYNAAQAKKIMQEYQVSDLLSRILDQKKIIFDEIPIFLDPKIKDTMPNPLHFLDMEKAVSYTIAAIKNKKNICIYGDYDVDGATGSALLKNYFKHFSVDVQIYIPDRISEGYGPNIKAFNKLKRNNIDLVITVDCGTASLKEMQYAKSIGLDVIILDHHISAEIPEAIAVVNPNRVDETTKYCHLAAVGVAFMFVCAINMVLEKEKYFLNNKPDLLNFLDLVALGTVCDIMPIDNLNRAFIRQGLKIMSKRNNIGLSVLANISNITDKISTYDLGFVIGPKINAGGRVGEAYIGSQLLSCVNELSATEMALKLHRYNIERKAIEAIVLEEAIAKSQSSDLEYMSYVYSHNWHLGVIGIVASRLKERYNKPSFVMSIDGEYAKCSARSIKGIDIGSLIIKAKSNKLIDNGGGHAMAGGFTVHIKNIKQLQLFFNHEFSKITSLLKESSIKYYALKLPLKAINLDLYNELTKMAPFGPGNSEPVIKIEGIRILNFSLRANKHIICSLCDNNGGSGILSAVIYNAHGTAIYDYIMERYSDKDNISVIASIKKNEWNGKVKIQAIVKDICIL